ncbi:MAG: hypothetical protein JF586_01485 [Burkholderiales bacterium]|nr:hypothetical protein [Burkholderiales bacterium]
MKRPACLALVAAFAALSVPAAEPVTSAFHAAPPPSAAPARARPAARAPVPAANFLVEWRVQPSDARPAPHGDVVITSGSATTGSSGFGPGAVVVGTARPSAPQALRVANGKEGSVVFDRSETRTVYDMAWTANASASATTDPSAQVVTGAASSASVIGGSRSLALSHASGVQSHEVVVHRVDGLRVTPHWSHGDTLQLDVALTQATPAPGSRGATAATRASRDVDFHSTVEASFDEWLTVATVGDGGDELQIRVTWR